MIQLEDGGLFFANPLYTSNPADPRIQRYNDSMTLYNAYKFQKDTQLKNLNASLNQNRADFPSQSEFNQWKGQYLASFGMTDPNFDRSSARREFQNAATNRQYYMPEEKPIVDYFNKIAKSNKNFRTSEHTSPDLWHRTIAPVGTYWDTIGHSPIYKKPVQPVVYKPEEELPMFTLPEITVTGSNKVEPIPVVSTPNPFKNVGAVTPENAYLPTKWYTWHGKDNGILVDNKYMSTDEFDKYTQSNPNFRYVANPNSVGYVYRPGQGIVRYAEGGETTTPITSKPTVKTIWTGDKTIEEFSKLYPDIPLSIIKQGVGKNQKFDPNYYPSGVFYTDEPVSDPTEEDIAFLSSYNKKRNDIITEWDKEYGKNKCPYCQPDPLKKDDDLQRRLDNGMRSERDKYNAIMAKYRPLLIKEDSDLSKKYGYSFYSLPSKTISDANETFNSSDDSIENSATRKNLLQRLFPTRNKQVVEDDLDITAKPINIKPTYESPSEQPVMEPIAPPVMEPIAPPSTIWHTVAGDNKLMVSGPAIKHGGQYMTFSEYDNYVKKNPQHKYSAKSNSVGYVYRPGEGVVKYADGGEYTPPSTKPLSAKEIKDIKDFAARQNAKPKAPKQDPLSIISYLNSPEIERQMHSDTVVPMGYTPYSWGQEIIKRENQAILDRRKQAEIQAGKDIKNNPWANTLATNEHLTNAFRFFPNDPHSFIDDYLNPFQMVGTMAGNIGRHFASDAGPIDPLALGLDIAVPLGVGALGGLGTTTTGEFVNNVFNPLPGTGIINKIATGNSILPFAWRSPAVGLSEEASQTMFNKLLNSNKLTDPERALITEYQYNSRPFTGRGVPVDIGKQNALNDIIKKYDLNVNGDVLATRRFNPENNSLGAEWQGNRLNLGNRPSSFSAGVGTPGYASGAVDRLVIPQRHLKGMGNNFIVNQYTGLSDEAFSKLSPEIQDFAKSWLDESAIGSERELIGTGLDFKRIGKVKNDIGGYDHIVKPFENGGPVYVPTTSNNQQLGYDPLYGTITYNPNDPIQNINNPWWKAHEDFHHKQNMEGNMSTYGKMGIRPNPYVASEQSISDYYNRRDTELNNEINKMVSENPELQFVPKNKLKESIFPVAGQQPSFLGAEERMYNDPSTLEGEARQEEMKYKKEYANGGQQLDGFKKRLIRRYPGMQSVYGDEGQNLNIIKDPNYAASDYGYGNIEFFQPGQKVITYSDDYQYINPTPSKYTTVYNPKGANRGDVFLDMMHGMRNDKDYMKLLNAFDESVKNARGNDMQYFYEQDVKNGYTDGQEQWDKNYVDGQLRAQLAPGTLGMFSHGRRDYRKERKYSTPEMKEATENIHKYLKGKYANVPKNGFENGGMTFLENGGLFFNFDENKINI